MTNTEQRMAAAWMQSDSYVPLRTTRQGKNILLVKVPADDRTDYIYLHNEPRSADDVSGYGIRPGGSMIWMGLYDNPTGRYFGTSLHDWSSSEAPELIAARDDAWDMIREAVYAAAITEGPEIAVSGDPSAAGEAAYIEAADFRTWLDRYLHNDISSWSRCFTRDYLEGADAMRAAIRDPHGFADREAQRWADLHSDSRDAILQHIRSVYYAFQRFSVLPATGDPFVDRWRNVRRRAALARALSSARSETVKLTLKKDSGETLEVRVERKSLLWQLAQFARLTRCRSWTYETQHILWSWHYDDIPYAWIQYAESDGLLIYDRDAVTIPLKTQEEVF